MPRKTLVQFSQIMTGKFLSPGALFLATLFCSTPNLLMSQTNQTDAARWLAKARIAPPFTVPGSRAAWERKRKQVRAQLWELLGKLPPRPKLPKIETLSREEGADYLVEKFQFD